MRLNQVAVVLVVIASVVFLATYSMLPMVMFNPVHGMHTEPAANYWVKAIPITSDLPMYTSVGQNWTLTFKAVWSFGDKAGQLIENATATIEVQSTITNTSISILNLNTTSGIFSFDYTTLNADILSFNIIKLTTAEGKEYSSDSFDADANVWGLQSEDVTVWYDTFHVVLVDSDTTIQGAIKVLVNVTYAFLPEEGLILPGWATYSGETFLPKIVHGQIITINGIQAQETSIPGIYAAEVPTWFPTTYIHVASSQKNWTITHTGFIIEHAANSPIWAFAVVLTGVVVTTAISFKLALLRKTDGYLSKRSTLPLFAGTFLAVASAISLYWTAVGINGTLSGFDWSIFTGLSAVSSVIGFAGAIMAFKRKNQAFTIASVIAPILVNFVMVKVEFDVYQLATPWIALFGAFAFAVASGILITNSEQAGQQQE